MVERSSVFSFERIDPYERESSPSGELELLIEQAGFVKSLEIVDQTGVSHLYKAPVDIAAEVFGRLPDQFSLLQFKFKGGLARAALANKFGATEPVKDIDAIIVADEYIDRPNQLWEFSRDYESQEAYFTSRDFTMNEVLLEPEVDGTFTLTATREAIIDYLNGVICPSVFERQDESLRSRIVTRGIRFAAERIHRGDHVSLAVPPAIEDNVYCFDLAVQLDRAITSGAQEEYLRLLQRLAYIPDDVYTVADLYGYLADELEYEGSDFVFDVQTVEVAMAEGEPVAAEKLFKKFTRLARDKRLGPEDFEIL